MSDSLTTATDVITALQTRLQAVPGLSASSVIYGVGANPPMSGKCLQWRMVSGNLDTAGGNLRSDSVAVPFEVRLSAPGAADTPYARDAATLALWQDLRTTLIADRTLGAIVRDVRVSDLTLPSGAADIGLPGNLATCIVTVVWQWKSVP